LAGTKVLVTAQRRANDLAVALERRGAAVTIAPSIGVESHIDETALLEQTRRVIEDRGVDVLVVTTGIGFRGWMETADAAGLATDLVEALRHTRLIARGPKASGALQAAGLTPDWVADSETSAEIADLLLDEGVAGLRVAAQGNADAAKLQRGQELFVTPPGPLRLPRAQHQPFNRHVLPRSGAHAGQIEQCGIDNFLQP
jgi:uroporphyrinogen-III synthase